MNPMTNQHMFIIKKSKKSNEKKPQGFPQGSDVFGFLDEKKPTSAVWSVTVGEIWWARKC